MTNMSNVESVRKTYPRATRPSALNAKLIKIRKRSFLNAVASTAAIFCEESTFHGLKNLCHSARGLRSNNISK